MKEQAGSDILVQQQAFIPQQGPMSPFLPWLGDAEVSLRRQQAEQLYRES